MPDSTPPDVRPDGCPEACGNVEEPYRWDQRTDEIVCFYGCSDCGTFWHTSYRTV